MPQVVDAKLTIRVRAKKMLADMHSPVSLFLKLRDQFSDPVLLESNDFRSKEDCFSFIGLDALATFKVQNGMIDCLMPGGQLDRFPVLDVQTVPSRLKAFLERFDLQQESNYGVFNGLFGHVGFDAVRYFDTLEFDPAKRRMDIPDIRFSMYRLVIAINHFKDEMYLIENQLPGEDSQLDKLEAVIRNPRIMTYPFALVGSEESNLSDEEFKELVRLGKHHCQIGDVFQIVFSRQFRQRFTGDEFNVYRVLRSINPSPYLFYFDYGAYRIFGSSPESQMVIRNGKAVVNPIAGTYRRSGDREDDLKKALDLSNDPKENAEHIMLVDLARNDLGRHAKNIRVQELKEIQFFSHVIHLVSKVVGDLGPETNPVQVFGDTFPAGTLSGAPKYKAIELINRYENQNRGFYGGSIGYLGFNGEMNQAILIRSFLSQNHELFYQAGAGVVSVSEEEKELQEVNNKLGALKKALLEAEKI